MDNVAHMGLHILVFQDTVGMVSHAWAIANIQTALQDTIGMDKIAISAVIQLLLASLVTFGMVNSVFIMVVLILASQAGSGTESCVSIMVPPRFLQPVLIPTFGMVINVCTVVS